MAAGRTSSTEERALSLLGSGVPAEAVASALGVTASRISKLLSQKEFSAAVVDLRVEKLSAHTVRDTSYDKLEDRLLEKMEKSLPLLFKPQDILKAIQVINGAKRRGTSAGPEVTQNQNIVNLILPAIVAEKFTVNIDNQVTRAGTQELLTLSSGALLESTEKKAAERASTSTSIIESQGPL